MFTIIVAEAAGFLFLWVPCLLGAFTAPIYQSSKAGHGPVDRWSWGWLNAWYSNIEDGVSGQQAIVYVDGAGHLGTYASTFPKWTPKWVIAYAWSAWRNGANNLKRPLRSDKWAS